MASPAPLTRMTVPLISAVPVSVFSSSSRHSHSRGGGFAEAFAGGEHGGEAEHAGQAGAGDLGAGFAVAVFDAGDELLEQLDGGFAGAEFADAGDDLVVEP